MCNIRCLSTNTPNIRYVPTYLKKHPGTWETFCSYLPEETSRNLRNILLLLTWRNIQELEKHSVPTYLKKHPGTQPAAPALHTETQHPDWGGSQCTTHGLHSPHSLGRLPILNQADSLMARCLLSPQWDSVKIETKISVTKIKHQ